MTTEISNPSGTQALQALLNSVAPRDAPGDKLSAQSLQALASKLGELIPESNSSGQLNEEGLPIIEVTEPHSATLPVTGNSIVSDESPLVPLSSLTPEQRQTRQAERDRILDLLEVEEQQERERERNEFLETHAKEIDQRKKASEAEAARFKAKKELQKKMGKALMQQMSEARDSEQKHQLDAEVGDLLTEQARRESRNRPKKKVSFANLPESPLVSPEQLRSPEWIKPQSALSLPMKNLVVERVPHTPPPAKAQFQTGQDGDSDDDSDFEPPSSSDDDDDDEVEDIEDEPYDIDEAAHQRQIAAEYYHLRTTIGSDAHAAMASHNQPEPNVDHSDPSLRPPAKPAISRFRAETLATEYNASSPQTQPLATVPESAAHTLQKTVRTGKLDEQNRLVGVDGDSASEDEDPELQEILELLRQGQMENLGPGGGPLPPSIPAQMPSIPPLPSKLKTSQFKLRSQQPRIPETPESSSPSTPTNILARSSPKLSSPQALSNPGFIIDSPSFSLPESVPTSSISKQTSSVMSTNVMERKPLPPATTSILGQGQQPKKASRFLASRAGG